MSTTKVKPAKKYVPSVIDAIHQKATEDHDRWVREEIRKQLTESLQARQPAKKPK